LGLRFQGSEFRVRGVGYGVWGLRIRVQGLGFMVCRCRILVLMSEVPL